MTISVNFLLQLTGIIGSNRVVVIEKIIGKRQELIDDCRRYKFDRFDGDTGMLSELLMGGKTLKLFFAYFCAR